MSGAVPAPLDAALIQAVVDLARQYGRYGYRRITAPLHAEGWHCNHNTLAEARVLIEQWRQHDNTQRPHSALGHRPPPAPEATIMPHTMPTGGPGPAGSAPARPVMHRHSSRTTNGGWLQQVALHGFIVRQADLPAVLGAYERRMLDITASPPAGGL